MSIYKWLRVDESGTHEVGWTANLAIFRIIYLYAAILPIVFQLLRWTEKRMPLQPIAAWQPISFYRWIPNEVLRNADLAHALTLADLWLIIFALLGFCTRSMLGLAAVLSVYLFGLTENFGTINHIHHNVWFMALLAAGPSGEMLSLDAVLKAMRKADRGKVELEVSDHSALSTLRYLWIMIGLLYLSSGIGKLTAALGSHWLDPVNLQNIMRRRWIIQRLYYGRFSLPVRPDRFAPELIRLIGLGVIVFETTAIILVLFRRSRWLVVLCGLAFHLSNGVVLQIWFVSLMIAYVALIDWVWLCRVAMNRVGRTPVWLLYDENCRRSRRTIAIIKTLDICGWLRPVAFSVFSQSRGTSYPEIGREMLARDVYVVGENGIAAGYDAYRIVFAPIPLLWPFALMMRIPPIAAIGLRCYRHIAENRSYRLPPKDQGPASAIATGKRSVYRAPHVVGLFLLAGETITVMLNSGIGFGVPGMIMRRPPSALSLTGWKREKLLWPFDQYPSFAYGQIPATYTTWEPRLVHADGTESEIPPETFARTFGGVSTAEANVQQAITFTDPVRRSRHALTVARMLWTNLPKSAKNSVVAIRGYKSVFSIDPSDTEPASRALIDTFPLELLQNPTNDRL